MRRAGFSHFAVFHLSVQFHEPKVGRFIFWKMYKIGSFSFLMCIKLLKFKHDFLVLLP